MDPGTGFIEDWNKRYEALEISHLRSPAFAHPRAYEPWALVNFAQSHGRTHELLDVPLETRRLATADSGLGHQEPMLFGVPSSALFKDFCASLEANLPHQWVSGRAEQVHKDERTGKFRVRYTNGTDHCWVVADAVVLATGPTGRRNVPQPFSPFVDSGCVTHTEEFLSNGKTVASMASQLAGDAGSARLLVIGGGLTAAQAALAAVAAGSQVVLRSRRPLMTRAYDINKDWLDQRYATRLRSEFLTAPVEERLKMAKGEVRGGSVPESYMNELRRLASTSDRLELQVSEGIDHSVVLVQDGKVHVDGDVFDHVILATGSSTAPGLTPLFKQVESEFGLPMLDRFPLLDDALSWMDGEDLYVVGANAVLELGPGALNLMGAMRGAKIVAEALRDLMWSNKRSGAASTVQNLNQFALLDTDGSGSDESDSESDSEE
jgi:hypothetical protein